METASAGAEIYWEQTGAGPPLVLLHGNGGDCGIFSRQTEFFSAKWRVIGIDSRGHGRSSRGADRLSLYDMADDVLCVLNDANVDKANILGFSDGANIAMIFAIRYPERVRSLVLSGANAEPSGLKLAVELGLWLQNAVCAVGSVFSAKACAKKELLDLMLGEPKLKKWDLERITAPTLLTAGENDIVRPGHITYLHNNIAGSQLHIFPGGHFTPFKLHEQYNDIVLQFLRRYN